MTWGRAKSIAAVEPLVRMAELAKLDRNTDVQETIKAAAISGNASLAQNLTQVLHVKAVEELLRNVPFRTPEWDELCHGLSDQELGLLGIILDSDRPFLYPFNWLNQHAYVGGGSGTGKTNFLYGTALQTMQHCAVWIFDRDKQDYRHLIRMRRDLLVLDAQDTFVFNPLEVPSGVRPEHWITAFVTIFCKSNALLDGSEALLLKAVHELYEERSILVGGEDFPTLFDLLAKVRAYTFRRFSREAGYQDSIVNRIDSYLLTGANLYGYARGFSIAELGAKHLVLEVRLSERHARCLMNWILFALFLHRIANAQRGNILRNLVIIDEGKWAAPPGYNQNIGFVPLASILAQSREAGIGIILADQTANLDESIFVQSRLKKTFRLGSGEDIERIRKTFALSREQAEFIPSLDVGQAVVRVPRIDPFLVRVPKVRLG